MKNNFLLSTLLFAHVAAFGAQRTDFIPYTKLTLATYFDSLDYNVSRNARAIPRTESYLVDRTQAFLAALGSGKITNPQDSARLLIYTALYISNANVAIEHGKLSESEVECFGAQDAMPAREGYMVKILEKARKLRPDDRRVDGWLGAAKIRLDYYKLNTVSAETLDFMMAAIDRYPTFNLWTYYIVSKRFEENGRKIPLTSAQRTKVRDLTLKMVELKGGTDVSVTDSSVAPFNREAGATILADEVATRVLDNPEKSPVDKVVDKMKMPFMLRGIYGSLDDEAGAQHTAEWADNPAREKRMELAKSPTKDLLPYLRTPTAAKVYNCASCHAR